MTTLNGEHVVNATELPVTAPTVTDAGPEPVETIYLCCCGKRTKPGYYCEECANADS